jgi:uncharacterized damage-inducible protein DinB
MNIDELKYPIGKFETPKTITPKDIKNWLSDIGKLPSRLVVTLNPLSEAQLNTPYREGGWTVRQIVHHIADSHLQSYIRFKTALTEETPVIRVYDREAWAQLPDSKSAPVESSLLILEGLLGRWNSMLNGLSQSELQRSFVVPASEEKTTLAMGIGLCSWHGQHHLQQIVSLIKRSGW